MLAAIPVSNWITGVLSELEQGRKIKKFPSWKEKKSAGYLKSGCVNIL
jgi:hypothetical protein